MRAVVHDHPLCLLLQVLYRLKYQTRGGYMFDLTLTADHKDTRHRVIVGELLAVQLLSYSMGHAHLQVACSSRQAKPLISLQLHGACGSTVSRPVGPWTILYILGAEGKDRQLRAGLGCEAEGHSDLI